MSNARRANRLIDSTSPYLLQHAHNPVDWFPWGPEALAKAKSEDRPIFLSIGYSACHWCHVMERESFESDEIARLLNEHFVPVKVDREERPDLDELYMTFVQAFTGHGGWPMSTFLTPDGTPFFGGTYWPPYPSRGMPGFTNVLMHVMRLWREKRDEVKSGTQQVIDYLRGHGEEMTAGRADLNRDILEQSVPRLARGFDSVNGGFGSAPKFPHSQELSLFLRRWGKTRDADWRGMVELSLTKMAWGGIYDQIGGGFARYSVDGHWAVPHFEKMLYDNALLTRTYLEMHQISGDPVHATTARETFNWLLSEMTDPAGGFWSTLDADSEGEEGRFYVWTPAQIREVLGEELGAFACRWFDVNDAGNFEHGASTLTLSKTPEQFAKVLGLPIEEVNAKIAEARKRLFEARAKRVRPGTDTKILAAWNGLMIAALARGAQVLDEPRYAIAAGKAADFVLGTMVRDGRLLRTCKDGKAHISAYAEDYACLIEALVDLYETDFDPVRLAQASALADTLIKHYGDPAGGGFFFTADDAEALLVRSKNPIDNATPSGNSVAAGALLRLATLTGNRAYFEAAEGTLRAFSGSLAERPFAFAHLLSALDQYLAGAQEIAIVGPRDNPEVKRALAAIRKAYLPDKAVALREPDGAASTEHLPLLAGKSMIDGKPTFYVCRDYACAKPVHTAAELMAQLG